MIVDDLWASGMDKFFIRHKDPHVVRLPFPLGVDFDDGGVRFKVDDLAIKLSPILVQGDKCTISLQWARAPFDSLIFYHSPRESSALCLEADRDENKEKWRIALISKAPWRRMSAMVAVAEVGEGYLAVNKNINEMAKQSASLTSSMNNEVDLEGKLEAYMLEQFADDSSYVQYTEDIAKIAMTAVSLINARNIAQRSIEHDAKIQKARMRKGLRPLFRYHELLLQPFKSIRERGESKASGDLMPIHWIRGHFKEFSRERPLFGKYSGRYWWQPHISGKDTSRKVEKSYAIDIGQLKAV